MPLGNVFHTHVPVLIGSVYGVPTGQTTQDIRCDHGATRVYDFRG
ncbi:MAG: hypothetical protein ACI9MN_000807, partial [Saprospiraceae bacterium]